ncbi:MAG: metalloregulator ArsR/SmtB family transcription factor [Candidatus Aminicenantes bacterium]|jgi:ArsR family transcriptional regulator
MLGKIEKTLRALGDRSRLSIINMLGEKSLCVCEIKEVLKLSQSTVSGHLRVLKEANRYIGIYKNIPK